MSMPLSVNFASRLNQRKLPALRAIQLKLGRMGTLQSADKTKDHAMHGLLFCWIPAGEAERPQCGNKRGVSPVSNERCKRRRSSATIANCNTYSPHPVRNSRGASGLKPTPTAPLLTSRGCHKCQPVRASQQSTGLFRA